VYKKVLDNILELAHGLRFKSEYGFNPGLEKYFSSKVFAFPMPGTPCNAEQAAMAMTEFRQVLRSPGKKPI
jgi:hypothetical protein